MTSQPSAIEAVVKLSGDIDIQREKELHKLEKSLVEPESVIFDLSNVEYVDTTFLRFLLNVRRHTNKAQRSSVKLVGLSRRVRRIFEVTGLAHVFEIERPLADHVAR